MALPLFLSSVHTILLTVWVADSDQTELCFWWIPHTLLPSFISVWRYGQLRFCYIMDIGASLRSPSMIFHLCFLVISPTACIAHTQRARRGWEFVVPGIGFSYDVSCDWCVRLMASPAPLPEVPCRGDSGAHIHPRVPGMARLTHPFAGLRSAVTGFLPSPVLASFLWEHFRNNPLHTNLCLRVCC